MERQVIEVDREVINTNNNPFFHFRGRNNYLPVLTKERCIKSDNALPLAFLKLITLYELGHVFPGGLGAQALRCDPKIHCTTKHSN